MNRRQLIKSGFGTALAGTGHALFSAPVHAGTSAGTAARTAAQSAATLDATAAGAQVDLANPQRNGVSAWAQAYAKVQRDYQPITIAFDRPLPAGLQGTLYRNGPALMQRGTTAFRHWFDGDALVHAYRIGGNRLNHRASMVRTERFAAEEAAGRYLWDGFGTSIAGARPLNKPDDVNVANISVLPVDGELLALWEAGSPYRLDPQSLATRGRKVFSAESDRLPFSAHPRVDRDGTIWSFGYLSGSGKIILYRLDRGGSIKQLNVVDAPNADMIHDFAITERFLVFSLMPLIAEPRARYNSALERYQWHPERAGVVLLIDKNTLAIAHRIEMPALMNFHLGNAWDDGQSVRFHSMQVGDYHGLMNAMYSAVAGSPIRSFRSADDGIVECTVDLASKQVSVSTLASGGLDFPAWDKRRTGQRSDHLMALRASSTITQGSFAVNELVLIDHHRGRRGSWDYGSHEIAEEHLFAPSRISSTTRGTVGRAGNATDPGWVIGTHYNWLSQRTTMSVFDSRAIDDGPIANAQLPYGFPPGLHGAYVAG